MDVPRDLATNLSELIRMNSSGCANAIAPADNRASIPASRVQKLYMGTAQFIPAAMAS